MIKECVKVVAILLMSFPNSHIIIENPRFNFSYKVGYYALTTREGAARRTRKYSSIINIIDRELFNGNPKVSSRR